MPHSPSPLSQGSRGASRPSRRSPKALCLFALLALWPAAAQAQGYLRAGLGWDWSEDSSLRDVDCAQTQPPALFGCGPGLDERPLAAEGDFGSGGGLDAGLGYRLSPRWRVEAQLTWREGLDFGGEANFLGVEGAQPVRADADSLSALLLGYWDLPALGAARPFVGLGLGVARNSLSRVHYGFPGLGAEAATITRGDRHSDLAWQLNLGFALGLREGLLLDVAYRYSDLGDVETAAGGASIVRQSGVRAIDVGATRAELRSHGLALSLRYEL